MCDQSFHQELTSSYACYDRVQECFVIEFFNEEVFGSSSRRGPISNESWTMFTHGVSAPEHHMSIYVYRLAIPKAKLGVPVSREDLQEMLRRGIDAIQRMEKRALSLSQIRFALQCSYVASQISSEQDRYIEEMMESYCGAEKEKQADSTT